MIPTMIRMIMESGTFLRMTAPGVSLYECDGRTYYVCWPISNPALYEVVNDTLRRIE
jgi:hypothetical protein